MRIDWIKAYEEMLLLAWDNIRLAKFTNEYFGARMQANLYFLPGERGALWGGFEVSSLSFHEFSKNKKCDWYMVDHFSEAVLSADNSEFALSFLIEATKKLTIVGSDDLDYYLARFPGLVPERTRLEAFSEGVIPVSYDPYYGFSLPRHPQEDYLNIYPIKDYLASLVQDEKAKLSTLEEIEVRADASSSEVTKSLSKISSVFTDVDSEKEFMNLFDTPSISICDTISSPDDQVHSAVSATCLPGIGDLRSKNTSSRKGVSAPV